MFNIRLRNLFIVLFLLISLTLTYGCSSKPSEKTMKDIIVSIEKPYNYYWFGITDRPIENKGQVEVKNYNFEEFKITNEFKSKKDDKEYYNIKVNYKCNIEYFDKDDKSKTIKGVLNGEDKKFSFNKLGKEWNGTREFRGTE